MIISRTSTAHTIASIEPYESGQDRSQPATSPCMVLTICREASQGNRPMTHSNLNQHSSTDPPKFNGDLSATAVFHCWSILKRRRTRSFEALGPSFDEGTLTMLVAMRRCKF